MKIFANMLPNNAIFSTKGPNNYLEGRLKIKVDLNLLTYHTKNKIIY